MFGGIFGKCFGRLPEGKHNGNIRKSRALILLFGIIDFVIILISLCGYTRLYVFLGMDLCGVFECRHGVTWVYIGFCTS